MNESSDSQLPNAGEQLLPPQASPGPPPQDSDSRPAAVRGTIAAMKWVADHCVTLGACAVAVYAVRGVPQVRHLLDQPPTESADRICFLIVVTCLLYLYGTSLLDIWRPLRLNLFTALPVWLNGSLVRTAIRRRSLARGITAQLLSGVLFVGGLAAAWYVPFEINEPYLLFGGLLKILALWLSLAGLFLAYGLVVGPARVIRWADETNQQRGMSSELRNTSQSEPGTDRGSSRFDRSVRERRSGWDFVGTVFSWLLWTTLVGELFWVTAELKLPFASLRLYTIWAVVHVAVSLVVVASLIDFFHRHSVIPARLLAAGLLFAGAWLQGGEFIEVQSDVESAEPWTKKEWLTALNTRLQRIPEGPVVLVAASGGGSRAALFTSLVLQMLATEPMTLPSVEPDNETEAGSDRNVTQKPASWANHVLMISGVSGGSIATARYVSDPETAVSAGALQHTNRTELIRRCLAQIDEWLPEPGGAALSPAEVAAAGRLNEVRQHIERLGMSDGAAADVTASAADSNAQTRMQAVAETAFAGRLADDMSADFMAAILRGFLVPFSSRGEGLYHFWNGRFGWGTRRLGDRSPEDFGEIPLVLYNATDVDSGRRIVLGDPPVPEELPAGRVSDAAAAKFSRQFADSGYFPVSAVNAAGAQFARMPLARAVRLSSNFPFGFHVSEFSVPWRTDSEEEAPDRLRILDGGVVDNTGIDSLHAVFTTLHRAALRDPVSDEARILAEIRRRGVVFIEIDSGAKPSRAGTGGAPFAGIGQPVAALSNSAYSNALRAGDVFTEELSRILSHWLPAVLLREPVTTDMIPLTTEDFELSVTAEQLRWAVPAVAGESFRHLNQNSVHSVRFVCNHVDREESHVMTALALGPQDKAAVIAQFLDEYRFWQSGAEDRQDLFATCRRLAVDTEGESSDNRAVRNVAVDDLLRAAETEMSTARNKLQRLADYAWGGPPKSDGEIATAKSILMRPYTLLMGVRAVADPDSAVFKQKGRDLSLFVSQIRSLYAATVNPMQVVHTHDSSSNAGNSIEEINSPQESGAEKETGTDLSIPPPSFPAVDLFREARMDHLKEVGRSDEAQAEDVLSRVQSAATALEMIQQARKSDEADRTRFYREQAERLRRKKR